MKKGYKTLAAYAKAFDLAKEIHVISRDFPKEERYALTDQIRRSSRSICANLAEGYRKRRYPKHFISKVIDSYSECTETIVWLDFSMEFGYIDAQLHERLISQYDEVEKLLHYMEQNPAKFAPNYS